MIFSKKEKTVELCLSGREPDSGGGRTKGQWAEEN